MTEEIERIVATELFEHEYNGSQISAYGFLKQR
jgi:hypothetical protein